MVSLNNSKVAVCKSVGAAKLLPWAAIETTELMYFTYTQGDCGP